MDEAASTERTAGEMSLGDHFRELRSRLLKALLALVVGAAAGYAIFPWILELLIAPYCNLPQELTAGDCSLVALRPLEPFSVRIRTALVIGLFVAGPVIFFQLWRFITPGLTRRERRWSLPFVVLSQLMAACGILFAYFVIPTALAVLLSLGGPQITPLLSATEYLSFFLTMCLAFALVFEVPLVLISLTFVGVVSASGLRRARPYAVVSMTIAAAIVTPTTDAVTLLLVAGPLWLFYELSVLTAWLIGRRREKKTQ